VVCKTDPAAAKKHEGISFLLCPIAQPGIELRPITQLTGTAEFNEVFFVDARTPADMVVGPVGQGWKVVMATLGFERGTAFLAQQLRFAEEFGSVVDFASDRGRGGDAIVRQRLAEAYTGLEIMRLTGLRTVSQIIRGGTQGPESSIGKLHWSSWHQRLGELAMDLMGADGLIGAADVADEFEQRRRDYVYTFLFSRADTIYAGSSEIQRNIVGERVLGLPREPA
jgi:alkylation response protein AidB-like acyl-CoA dehydrogenase